MTKANVFQYVLLALGLAASACSSGKVGESSPSSDPSKGYGGTQSAGSTGGSSSMPGVVLSVDAAVPKEIEQTVDFLSPKAGGRFVFAANPSRDSVAIIDSLTQGVSEVTPGDAPTYLATVPGKDVALVVNVGSGTLSILKATVSGTTVSNPLPVVKTANAIDIAPDGLHAVAWFDLARASGKTITGSMQEVTLIDLSGTPEKTFTLTVGYKPTGVVFSEDGKAGFVITRDGISKIVFAEIKADAITPLVRIGASTPVPVPVPDAGLPPEAGPVSDAKADVQLDVQDALGIEAAPIVPEVSLPVPLVGDPIDVSVTKDGHYAIARRENSSEVVLVDLQTKVVTSRLLSSALTDLDLWESPVVAGGTFAFAVLRAESKLVKLAIPDGFAAAAAFDTWPFPDDFIGQVTVGESGKRAVLYSTATTAKQLVSVDLSTGGATRQSIRLEKAIRAVALSPDEKTAFVVHTKASGNVDPSLSIEEQLNRSYGFSVIALQDGFPKLILTPAMPEPFVITPDSAFAFALIRDDTASVRLAKKVSLTSFQTTDFQLGSPPSGIGALSIASQKIFISQVHSEGRISFIDWKTDAVETITGFALNGRIRQ